jgi:hypothetical protein
MVGKHEDDDSRRPERAIPCSNRARALAQSPLEVKRSRAVVAIADV